MTTTSYNIYQQLTSVRVASASNLSGEYFNGPLNNGLNATLTAFSVGALSIDGVLVNVGDRILLFNQTNTIQDGIYVVNATGGPISLWQIERSADFQSLEQIKTGQFLSVGAGETLAGVMFVIVEPLPSIIGMDGSFTFIDVSDQAGGGPFLTIAANLDDLGNKVSAFENLGLGRPGILLLQDSDFAAAGGTYVLTNPPPIIISMAATTPGRVLQLPPQNEDDSLQASQQIELLTGTGSQSIGINSGAGNLIFTVDGDSAWRAVPNDRSSLAGAWQFLGEVQTINGNLTGNVVIPFGPIGSPAQLLYVSNDGNDMTGDGTIGNPFATYEVARLAAVAGGATAAKPYSIEMIGVFNITGGMIFNPFINIVGVNRDASVINVSGSVTLDPSWATDVSPIVVIQNLSLAAAGGVNLTFTGAQPNVRTLFQGVNLGGSSSVNITGSGSTNTELVIFFGCISFGGGAPLTFTNMVSAVIASSIAAGITAIANSVNTGPLLILQNNDGPAGNIHIQTTGSGTLTVALSNNINLSSTLTLDGTGITFVTDSTGYNIVPTFLNGATFNDITLISLADGVNANENFTPTNYTPAVSSLFKSNSVTANLAGIDEKLIIQSWDGSQTPVDVTAGSGIDITDGVISLTGTGPSTGYSYITNQMVEGFGVISFTDTTTYLIPFSTSSPLVDESNNFSPFYDGASHLGIQYTDTEDCVAQITFILGIQYPSTNVNPSANTYVLSVGKNGASPINPITGASASDIPFTVNPSEAQTEVVITIQVDMSQNDVIYPTIRNTGTTTASLNRIFMPYYTIVAQKVGDIGGTAAGVASLNGLTGNLNITSSDSTLNVNPVGPDIDVTLNTVPIGYGGTNAVFYPSPIGVFYFNNVSFVNSNNFTYDNTIPTLTLTANVAAIFSLVKNTGTDQVATFYDNNWSVGIKSSSTSLSFWQGNGAPALFIDTSDNVNIPGLSVSSLVATDGSKNLISASGGTYNINITGTAAGGLAVTVISGTTASISMNHAYLCTNASLTTLTLPATFSIGDRVEIIGYGSGLVKIAQNSGQTIHMGNVNSTTGITGFAQTMDPNGSLYLVAVTVNNDLLVSPAPQGNVNLV